MVYFVRNTIISSTTQKLRRNRLVLYDTLNHTERPHCCYWTNLKAQLPPFTTYISMASTIALALLSLVVLYALKIGRQFARNLAAAKASGITYTIVPFYHVNRLYQLSCILVIPIMRSLPQKWIDPWFELTLEWGWSRRYEPFKRVGSDTFITVSPERNVLYTADPDVVSQITSRRNDFPKALEVYESLKIYGNNVVTSEGQLWRHHRKIVSPPFTEKNNHLVWNETLDQTRAMVDSWLSGGPTIYTIADDSMRLSLHVISRAGFGVHLQWPGQEKTQGNERAGGKDATSSAAIPEGHEMSYTDALGSLLHNVLTLLITPRFLLSKYDPSCLLSMFADRPRKFTVQGNKRHVHILHRMGQIHGRDVSIEEGCHSSGRRR